MAKESNNKAVKKTAAKKVVATKAAPKKVAAKKATPVKSEPVAVKKIVPKKTVAKKVAKKSTPKVATPAPAVEAAPLTTVVAKVDAGYGNELFIRGSGGGLTWDAGTLMNNVAADEWVWQGESISGEIEFKILLNDSVWSTGPNSVVFPGSTLVLEPVFEQ